MINGGGVSSRESKVPEIEWSVEESEMVNSPRLQKRRMEIRASILLLTMAILWLAPVRAQEAGGTIVGAVSDPSGAAVASANMTIRNVATGVDRTTPTNTDGLYVVPNLVDRKS